MAETVIIVALLIVLNYIIGLALRNLDAWEVQMLEEDRKEWSED